MGFNKREITKTRITPIRSFIKREKPKTKTFLKIPFISDKINSKIKKILKENDLNVNLAQRSISMSHYLNNKKKNNNKTVKNKCQLRRCSLKNEKLCVQSNVVYQLQCPICNAKYIGSTLREFHIRYNEHIKNSKSAINQHMKICRAQPTASIIARDHRRIYLRYLEAMNIKKLKPELNKREEISKAQSTYL